MRTSFHTIANKAEGLYKDKGSRFLAFAEPVSSEDEAKEKLADYRKTYHDARHVCFAYKMFQAANQEGTEPASIARSSDDGEPSGTAGKPIMGRIESAGLDNILIVVVRYFGGILLGTGGLVVAYREAAADARARANIIECTFTVHRTLQFSFEQMHEVMQLLKETDSHIVRQDWTDSECEMEIVVPLHVATKFDAYKVK